MSSTARLIAFYLPQFHPIPENDQWWGKGFTEWTNVGKAKALFKGHYQPKIPADLGYYDLRIPEVREKQAQMAKNAGIEGFAYWHYWFGNGRRLLERPFNEVLQSKKPDFPFCLSWANETWKGFDHGLKNRNILIEQKYPGVADFEEHFYHILPALSDDRYIRVDEKPLFMVYRPFDVPNVREFLDLWRNLAIKNGLKGIYFVGQIGMFEKREEVLQLSFDAVNIVRMTDYLRLNRSLTKKVAGKLNKHLRNMALVFDYKDMSPYFTGPEDAESTSIPTIIPNWDHTPRSGREGLVIDNSTPELFEKHLKEVLNNIKDKPEQHRIAYIKSWNEWGEGNYLEPDLKYGHRYLDVIKNTLNDLK